MMTSLEPKHLVIVPYFLPEGPIDLTSPYIARDITAVKSAVPAGFAPDFVIGQKNPVTRHLGKELGASGVRSILPVNDRLPSNELEAALRLLTKERAVLAFVDVTMAPVYIAQLGSKADPEITERRVWTATYLGEWRDFSLGDCKPGDSTRYNKIRPATRLAGAVDFRNCTGDDLVRGNHGALNRLLLPALQRQPGLRF